MSNRNKEEQVLLRELVEMAILKGILTPNDIFDFVIDNGWKYSDPTKMTIIKIMRSFGVEYVSGYWTKVK